MLMSPRLSMIRGGFGGHKLKIRRSLEQTVREFDLEVITGGGDEVVARSRLNRYKWVIRSCEGYREIKLEVFLPFWLNLIIRGSMVFLFVFVLYLLMYPDMDLVFFVLLIFVPPVISLYLSKRSKDLTDSFWEGLGRDHWIEEENPVFTVGSLPFSLLYCC